jgi:serine/threonine protein kinase
VAFEWSADTQAFRSNDGPLERLGIRQLDRYAIQAKIGEGGMGVVYRARDVELGRAVAIKLLLPGRAESAAVRRRFEREAEALAKLRHPNLLQVHAAGEVEGNPYLVTEWLEGEGFDERLEREGPFPPEEAAALVAQVALALAHAHERGVLHRDIKPTNVLLVPGRGPVLIDFGLAKDADPGASRLTASGVFAGTAGYAAPEQLVDASSVDGLADVYGLGATLYTLLTGEAPVGGATTFQELLALCAAGKVPPPSEVREGIPRRIDEAVQKAMAPMPAERFADAQALAVALAPRSSASSGPPRRRWSRRPSWAGR